MKTGKEKLVEILNAFKCGVDSVEVHEGAITTLYEVRPKLGVRISKIRNLKDEIAIGLGADSVQIIAPLQGKGSVGIEIPNRERKMLPIEEVLSSEEYKTTDMALPCAIGETATGDILLADLAEMPHLLIAGATGQGKSVGLNTILMSLMEKRTPSEMQVILIDPKQVEFGVYSKLSNSYLPVPVITDANEAYRMLDTLKNEMEYRYTCLFLKGVRNIREYNEKCPDKKMGYVVAVIDEYGDLVMQAGKEMEKLICRLAQKARAVGIHLILSTQRPSVKIVTGDIKANFPVRIAFRTTTSTDSRVVLGKKGAESLMGKGDMLYFNNVGTVRAQCAYTSTEYVEKKVNELYSRYVGTEQSEVVYILETLKKLEKERKEKEEHEKRIREYIRNTEPFKYAYSQWLVKPVSADFKKLAIAVCASPKIMIEPKWVREYMNCSKEESWDYMEKLEDYGFFDPFKPAEHWGSGVQKLRAKYDPDYIAQALDELEKVYNS